MDSAIPADHWVKLKESERKDKSLDLSKELKKIVEHESDGNTNCNWCFWYSNQRIGTKIGELGNKWASGHYPNFSIIKIGQNAEKSPGDLRRLVVTNNPMKNHRLTLVWKTRRGENDNKLSHVAVLADNTWNGEKSGKLNKYLGWTDSQKTRKHEGDRDTTRGRGPWNDPP